MPLEGFRVFLLVIMFICILNVSFYTGWLVAYQNRKITAFEATTVIMSLMSICSVATALWMGI